MLCRNPCKIPYRTPCGNLYSHVIHRAGSYIRSSVDTYAETYILSEIPMGIYTDSRIASYIRSCEEFYVGSHMGFFNRVRYRIISSLAIETTLSSYYNFEHFVLREIIEFREGKELSPLSSKKFSILYVFARPSLTAVYREFS